MELLAIVIPAIIILGAILVFAASRRSDADKARGQLSRETRQRDKTYAGFTDNAADDADEEVEPARVTGKEVERAAVLARTGGGEIEPVAAAAPVPWTPPDDEEIGVARRQFLNRSIIGLMSFSLAGFGAACVAFLWGGEGGGGFGSQIAVGGVADVHARIENNDGFLYVPEGRMWVTEYPLGSIKKAEVSYSPPELNGMRVGLVALFQKCPHLGCRVPSCLTSQWFECPCHGSQYNQVGEKRGGPAPRGMDRFAMDVNDDNVFVVDTGTIIQGPPIGTNTTGQEAEGPNCLGQADGHS
ncbi:MAG: ubiquinol-cytochrome c reductase iron-sulfur subunit [Acidimicrobiales bacterium]